MAWRYLVPGLVAAARLAAAQCNPGKGSTTISTQAEATALSACTTFKGDIWLAPNTKEDISLDGITRIQGSLLGQNVNRLMTSLSAEQLATIDDIFGLKNVTGLANLNFPSLTEVGQIDWDGVPVLTELTFNEEVSKADVVAIQNTGLNTLQGINLKKIGGLLLTNNNFLQEVSMKLESISGSLLIAANGRNVKAEFPNLEFAYNMTLKNISSLSIPKLTYVNSSMGFYSNFMEKLEIPKVNKIGGSLAFVSNGMLEDISMPQLTGIGGGLQIANNTKLEKVDGFPKLALVLGAIDMYGTFKSVAFPKIQQVRGAFNLQSSNNMGNTCKTFERIQGPTNKIQGKITCLDNVKHPTGRNGGTSDTGSGGGSSGAPSLLIPYASGVIGVVAAIFGML